MRAGFRNHGYYGHTFVGARMLSGIALVAIIGLVVTFTSQISKASFTPPAQLTGAMVVSASALLWVLLSFTAYEDSHIPYMATAIVDTLFLIPFVVVVIVLGGQLSQTECSTLPDSGNGTTLQLDPADGGGNGTLSYVALVATDQMTCYKLQGTWGLSIALCILFLLSALAAAFMYMRKRKNAYNGKFFGKNSARLGKGKPIKGSKSPETRTSQNVNSTRSAGPGSSEENKRSKQNRQQKNGQNQASSYDKGYSFFKPSTWYSSDKSSANSSSSTPRDMNTPGHSWSAQNVTTNNQAPDLSPRKNNAEPQTGSNETARKWTFGFGRLWRKGGGQRDGRDRSKNTAPPGHQQEDIMLTDVPQGRRNNPNTTASNSNRDLGGPQGESKGNGFLGFFRSRNETKNNSSTSPQPNRSLNHQGRPQQPFPPNSNRAVNSAGPLQGAAFADKAMPGKRQAPPAADVRGNGHPSPNVAGKGPQTPVAGAYSFKGREANNINNTKAGVKNVIPPQYKGGSAPPLTQGPNVPPPAMQRGRAMPSAALNGKNNTGITDLNNPKENPDTKGKNVAGAPDQRPGMRQPPAQNIAPLNAGPNGQNLQRKRTGFNEPKPLMPSQQLPPARNGPPLRPGEKDLVTKDEASSKSEGGVFSTVKNPLRPAQEKKGNELPVLLSRTLPNSSREGRGPLMNDPKIPAKQILGRDAPDQDESRGLNLPGRGKKGTAPPLLKAAQPKHDRELSPAKATYFKTPRKLTQLAIASGKTGAEKKSELEKRPKAGEPHTLQPQRSSFESETSVGAPLTAAGNFPPNKQGKQPAANGRLGEPPFGRNAQSALPPRSAPQSERDARDRLLPDALRRPGPAGPQAEPNQPGQPVPGSFPPGPSGKNQFPPLHGERPGPSKGIKAGGLPLRDDKGRPAPPHPASHGLPGGQQPLLDEGGRPSPQRTAGRPADGPGVHAKLAPGQRPQEPPGRLDARETPPPSQKVARPEVPGAFASDANNTRGLVITNNEPKQPTVPAREEHGKPRGPEFEPAVPNALAPGRNPRDERVGPPPQKPGVQRRDIANALLPGGRRSQESARDVKAPSDRRQLSPTRDGSNRPGSPRNGSGRRHSPTGRDFDGSRRPPSPQSQRGRRSGSRGPQPPPPGGRPPSPSNLRGPPGSEKKLDEMYIGGVRPQDINHSGRPMTPLTEASNLSTRSRPEMGRLTPARGAGAPGEMLPPPPSLRDPAMANTSSPSRGINGAKDRPPVPVGGRPVPPFPERSFKPQPPQMGGEKERGRQMPPAAAAAGGEPPQPPPFLRDPSERKETPAAQDVPPRNQPPLPDERPMPPTPYDQARNMKSEPRLMRNGRSRLEPPPVAAEQALPLTTVSNAAAAREISRPHPPPMLKDRQSLLPNKSQKERNMSDHPRTPINPLEKELVVNNMPAPFSNLFNERRQQPIDSRDPRVQQGPKDVGQPHLPLGVEADDRGGQAPFQSRDQQINDNSRPSTSSSRDMNAGTLDTNMLARNTSSAEPSSATGSPSKTGVLMNRLFGRKNKKHAEAMANSSMPKDSLKGRPSLLPPGREPQSILSDAAAPAVAGGVAQPDQRGRVSFSEPNEVRPEQQGRDLSRVSRDLPAFQPGVDAPQKSLVDTSIPHSRDGKQRPPPDPTVGGRRGVVSVFPLGNQAPPPMPPAANNVNEPNEAAAPARDLTTPQDGPKMLDSKEQKRKNRKSHALPGMVPQMPGQDGPVPAIPQIASSYMNSDELPTPADTQMPPIPVLDDKQRRAANRTSHMNGFGPADVQMPPVPSLPEQAPAHEDGLPTDSGKDKPGMSTPPSMGLRMGLPPRPTPRGAVKEPGRTAETGVPPRSGPDTERSDLSRGPQLTASELSQSTLDKLEMELESLSSSRLRGPDEERRRAHLSDSSLATADMLNTPPLTNNGFTSDKDSNREDLYGRTVKETPEPIADKKNRGLYSAVSSSLKVEDKASKKKDKSHGLPDDKQDEPNGEEETKWDYFGGLPGDKNQMPPLDSPTPAFNNDEPWAAGKDAEASRFKKPGFLDFGSYKKDSKQQPDGGSITGPPAFVHNPGQDEPWSTNGDAFDEKNSGDKKTTGLFGRRKDKAKVGSKSDSISPDKDSMPLDADSQLDDTALGERKSGLRASFSSDKTGENQLSPSKEDSMHGSPAAMYEQDGNGDVAIPVLLVVKQRPGSPKLNGQEESGQFDADSVDGDNEFPSLSEKDKKNKKSKGLFGFGKKESKNKKGDELTDGEMDQSLPIQAESQGNYRESFLPPTDYTDNEQDDSLFSHQPGSPASSEMGKKDKKGRWLLGRFGKSEDEDLRLNTMPSPGNEFDEHQSGGRDSFAASDEFRIPEGSMDSPGQFLEDRSSSTPYVDEEPLSPAQREKLKPAALFGDKIRGLFGGFGGGEGEQRSDYKRRSSHDFGGAAESTYPPPSGDMDEYSTDNMRPSPVGDRGDFDGNSNMPISPSDGNDYLAGNGMPTSPDGGIDDFGGNEIPPPPAGSDTIPPTSDGDMGNSSSWPASNSPSMEAIATPDTMGSPVQSPVPSLVQSESDAVSNSPAFSKSEMDMASSDQPEYDNAVVPDESELMVTDMDVTPPGSPLAEAESRGMGTPMELPAMDNLEVEDAGAYQPPAAYDSDGPASPGGGYSPPLPMADDFSGGSGPVGDYRESTSAFGGYEDDTGASGRFDEPELAYDFGGNPPPADTGALESGSAFYDGDDNFGNNGGFDGSAPADEFVNNDQGFNDSSDFDEGNRGLETFNDTDAGEFDDNSGPPISPIMEDNPGYAGSPIMEGDPGYAGSPIMEDDPGYAGSPIMDDNSGPPISPIMEDNPGYAGSPIMEDDPGYAGSPIMEDDPGYAGSPIMEDDPGYAGSPIMEDDPGYAGSPIMEDDPGYAGSPIMEDNSQYLGSPVLEDNPEYVGSLDEAADFNGVDQPIEDPVDDMADDSGRGFGNDMTDDGLMYDPEDEVEMDDEVVEEIMDEVSESEGFIEDEELEEGFPVDEFTEQDGEFDEDVEEYESAEDVDDTVLDDAYGSGVEAGVEDDMGEYGNSEDVEVEDDMEGYGSGGNVEVEDDMEGYGSGGDVEVERDMEGYGSDEGGEEDMEAFESGAEVEVEDNMGESGSDEEGEENMEEYRSDEEGEDDEDRELVDEDDDAAEDTAPGSPIGSEGELEVGDESDREQSELGWEEGSDDDDGLDDEELAEIMKDSGSDRGMDSPSMEASLEGPEYDQGQEEEAEIEGPTDEPQDQEPVVLASPVLTSAPPSPPPEQDTTSPQDEDSQELLRLSKFYERDIRNSLWPSSPNSDVGLSAISEFPNMEQAQSFKFAPVPDSAKRSFADGPLSPRSLATPPPEDGDNYDGQAYQHTTDPNYDVERALTPEEDYENFYDEDDEYQPHDQRNTGPSGPTFEDMDLSPPPDSSPAGGYSHHDDVEQGHTTTPLPPGDKHKTWLKRMTMSVWGAQDGGSGQDGSSNYTPPPPMPYDSGQFI